MACFQSPWLRENVLEQLCDVYDLIVEVEIESSQLPDPPDQCVERAFLAAEARRIRTLTEMLSDQEPGAQSVPLDLVQRYYELRRKIRQTEWMFYKAILRFPGDGFHPVNDNAANYSVGDRRTAFETKRQQLQTQMLELQTCLQEIQQADASFYPAEMVELASIESLQQLLSHERVAAVQITLTRKNGYAIVITRTETKAVQLAVNVITTVKPEIERLIVASHRSLHLFPFSAVSAAGCGRLFSSLASRDVTAAGGSS